MARLTLRGMAKVLWQVHHSKVASNNINEDVTEEAENDEDVSDKKFKKSLQSPQESLITLISSRKW